MELKTVEDVREYVFSKSAKLAFHWYSVYGFPFELFEEEYKKLSLLQAFILTNNMKKYL